MPQTTWTRKPEETPGTHRFDSRTVMTKALEYNTTHEERIQLMQLLRRDIESNEGLDYLQVFEGSDGRVVWVIDDGSYVTWLLPSDY